MIHETIKVSDFCNKLSDSKATIDIYIPSNSKEIDIDRKRKTIVICPGGGYEYTSDREGEPIALKFLAKGYNAIVLRYSVAPIRYPNQLLELAATVKYTREMKEEWNVDINQVLVCGFSAGGHLAGSLGVLWNNTIIEDELDVNLEDVKPNGMILSYPVITSNKYAHKGSFDNLLGEDSSMEVREKLSLEKLVTMETAKTFIWHTFDDGAVPVQNSLGFANALADKNIEFEMHIYPKGVHGLSLCEEITAMGNNLDHINSHVGTWFELVCQWIEEL